MALKTKRDFDSDFDMGEFDTFSLEPDIVDVPQEDKKEPGKFRQGLERALSSENISNIIIPLAAIAESVLTEGKSPGTAAMQHGQLLEQGRRAKAQREARSQGMDIAQKRLEQEEADRIAKQQTAKQSALERRLQAEARRELASLDPNDPKTEKRRRELLATFEGSEKTLAETPKQTAQAIPEQLLEGLSPEERLFAQRNPEKWLERAAKPEKQFVPMTDEEWAEFIKKEQLKASLLVQLKGNPLEQKEFDQMTSLRNEYSKKSKDYEGIRDAYRRVQESAKDPSAAGDLALIFNYMKILDPGSVVREGEFATAQNAAGIPDKIRNQYNKVLKGTRLAPDQRKDFLDRAGRLYGGQLVTQKQTKDAFDNLASQFGLNPSLVTSSVVILDPQKETEPQQGNKIVIMKDAAGNRARVEILPDGTKRVIEELQ